MNLIKPAEIESLYIKTLQEYETVEGEIREIPEKLESLRQEIDRLNVDRKNAANYPSVDIFSEQQTRFRTALQEFKRIFPKLEKLQRVFRLAISQIKQNELTTVDLVKIKFHDPEQGKQFEKTLQLDLNKRTELETQLQTIEKIEKEIKELFHTTARHSYLCFLQQFIRARNNEKPSQVNWLFDRAARYIPTSSHFSHLAIEDQLLLGFINPPPPVEEHKAVESKQ